ncbi:MAG TPA: hypothetical protein VI955_01330, partial [Candidatus Omnitrophota bacterium]|nr:hypothetical protein [Candidatus Omnitrophota bacterium]
PEVTGYLKGEHDLARAKYLMKLNTRHYVKRQLTWFRRDRRIEWVDPNLSFPNASVGNPENGPPIKTFGGDNGEVYGLRTHFISCGGPEPQSGVDARG